VWGKEVVRIARRIGHGFVKAGVVEKSMTVVEQKEEKC
jgi:hypothetical protein